MRNSLKNRSIGVRVGQSVIEWVTNYAEDSGLTISDVFRNALIEYKGRIVELQKAKDEQSLALLREHVGDMYRLRKTEDGLFLDRVEPQVITLGPDRRDSRG